ncbi:DUF6292 family protein [Amycolatopsis sp. NPDC059027]|uniref:DUF6292 family protein n=1 Tax=unclassified Amycolatopsis TaxID=2618356 RepID=UPI00367042DB
MKPDLDYPDAMALRGYVESVATELGVEPSAAWSEYGPPSAAYIALAERTSRYPRRLLMLDWSSDGGWALALEPLRDEDPIVLASWHDTLYPAPGTLAAWVREALGHREKC